MECFAKADHFVHLPKFPTYQQTIEIMAHCVFRLHNIPLDVISDQAPNSPTRYRETFPPNCEPKWVHHRAFTLNTLAWGHFPFCHLSKSNFLLEHWDLMHIIYTYHYDLLCYWFVRIWVFEDEIIVSSVEHHLRCCSKIWRSTRTAVIRSSGWKKCMPDSSPDFKRGQKGWYSTKELF